MEFIYFSEITGEEPGYLKINSVADPVRNNGCPGPGPEQGRPGANGCGSKHWIRIPTGQAKRFIMLAAQ
jgi:hypothetical protein